MAKLSVYNGATAQSFNIFIQNSSSTTGAGLTGLAATTSGLGAFYSFNGTNAGTGTITLATLATVTSAYLSGGFIQIDSSNMPGLYRFDAPNAMISNSKGRSVVFYFQGAANMAPCLGEIELTAVDNQSTGFGLVNASANVVQFSGVAVNTTIAQVGTNVVQYNGQTALTDANNLPKVDTEDWKGTAVGSPATAGIPDVNTKNINNVATTSVTTINANQGTTQPTNFTGTGASALVKVDVTDIAAAAVNTTLAQVGVNVVQFSGVGASATLAQVGVNVVNYAGQTALTDANNLPKVDVEDVGGAALSTHAAGMIPSDVRDIAGAAVNTSAAQLGVNVVNFGTTAVTGRDIGASVLLSPGTGTGQVSLVSGVVAANTIQFSGVAGSATIAQVGVNVVQVNGSATAASNVGLANQAIGRAVCTSGSTTASIVTSVMTPGGSGIVAGQFTGRTLIFDGTTTTQGLQGQATTILTNTGGSVNPTLTVVGLTSAPANGDTFGVY